MPERMDERLTAASAEGVRRASRDACILFILSIAVALALLGTEILGEVPSGTGLSMLGVARRARTGR